LIITGQELISDTLQRGEIEAAEVCSAYNFLIWKEKHPVHTDGEWAISLTNILMSPACGRSQWFLST